MTYAVIDIGTNTFILLIAKSSGKKSFKILHDQAVITRLGQGLIENHFLLSEAMKRSIVVLKDFKKTCKKFKVKKIMAIGTAACRTAANIQVFLNEVKKECGIKIDVITGDQEAEYVFLSAWHDFGAKNKKLIVVDIGGGSTEIITGPKLSNAKKASPETVISLPVGSVRLTEQYISTDPVIQPEFNRLITVVRNTLIDELDGFYPPEFNPLDYSLVATAGTATTLASLNKKLKKYSSSKVHGSRLKIDSLQTLINELAVKSVTDRQTMPGMEPLRADVIFAGSLLLFEIIRYFKQDTTLISDRGLRYGVLYKKCLKIV